MRDRIKVKNIIFDASKGLHGYWYAQLVINNQWINLMSEEKRIFTNSSSVNSLSKNKINYPAGKVLFGDATEDELMHEMLFFTTVYDLELICTTLKIK